MKTNKFQHLFLFLSFLLIDLGFQLVFCFFMSSKNNIVNFIVDTNWKLQILFNINTLWRFFKLLLYPVEPMLHAQCQLVDGCYIYHAVNISFAKLSSSGSFQVIADDASHALVVFWLPLNFTSKDFYMKK